MSKLILLLLLLCCILKIGNAGLLDLQLNIGKDRKEPKNTDESNSDEDSDSCMECPENERFVICPYNECVPFTCLEVNEIIDCSQRSVCPTKPGCMCIEGYARNDEGTCVSLETCNEMIPTTEGLSTTTENDETTTIEPLEFCNDALEDFTKAVTKFAANSLRKVSESNPEQTMVGSVLSQLNIFGVLYLNSKNDVLGRVTNLVGFSADKIRCVLQTIRKIVLNLPSGVIFDSFPLIVSNKQIPFTDSFKQDVENDIGGLAVTIDLSNRNAAKKINKLVESNTNGKVTNVVPENVLNKTTQIVLASGVYAKILFNVTFDPKLIKMRKFYVTASKIQTLKFYNAFDNFKYADSSVLKSQLLALPYKATYGLLIIRPYLNIKIKDVLKKLEDPKVLESEMKKMIMKPVDLYLPEIKSSTLINMTEELRKTNTLTTLLGSETAQLTNVVIPKKKVAVTLRFQKNIVISTPEGAFPPNKIKKQPSQKKHVVNCNCPFMFYTLATVEQLQLPVLAGIFNGN